MKPTAVLMKTGVDATCRINFGGFAVVDAEPIEDGSCRWREPCSSTAAKLRQSLHEHVI
jgi:hypothetical protein